MTAAALAAMEAPVQLIANHIGTDETGKLVTGWLRERQVPSGSAAHPAARTPRIVVTADDYHTRTWFAHLPEVVASLERADLAPIDEASFLYVDCYELIEQTVMRVIEAGRTAEVPMLLNLGGSEFSEPVKRALDGYGNLLVQTNIDDVDYEHAQTMAASLLNETSAAWVIVTAGASGSVAASHSEEVAVQAFPVEVRHTHCAGAAFSAGLLYGQRAGWAMERSMMLGSASGALRCTRHHSAPLPVLAELLAMLPEAERSVAS
ncbi:carbohydrate kinase family protein [Nocardia violaceofusca]|uniref:carbohydrate kinase family protein n=1 Tax=Nocardia violaceofusca TaxID=941182 RepID=UPI0007A555B6|nr:PfkB family carbohydrate kinase [Nocardia violaceofusca]